MLIYIDIRMATFSIKQVIRNYVADSLHILSGHTPIKSVEWFVEWFGPHHETQLQNLRKECIDGNCERLENQCLHEQGGRSAIYKRVFDDKV